jgi:hypothetical protein
MFTALLALPFAAQLLAPVAFDAAAQSQFSRALDQSEMRFRDMDRNNDRVITRAEWRGSAQSFASHDWNSDGILSGDEVRQGAVRPGTADDEQGLWDDREDTFENLDVNRNGRIERSEWHGSADAFQWLDRNNDGTLNRAEVVGRGAGPAGGSSQSSQRQGGRRRWEIPPPTTPPVGAQDCVSNPAQVVDDIYQQVLERSADDASAGMTRALASGQMTVRDIVAAVAKSPEHAEQFFWQPAVRTVYQRLLAREADPEGLRSFTNLARRDGLAAVEDAIVRSPEYRQRSNAERPASNFNDAYEAAVRSLYRHLLGRDPDPNGLRDLTTIAATQGFDPVVDRMIASAEYQRMYGTNTVPGRGIQYCGTAR